MSLMRHTTSVSLVEWRLGNGDCGMGISNHVLSDNVCIEAMSVNISRRTLERSEGNLDTLERKIRE